MHLDLDCFYAQVEMIYNPGLRDQPVGVYQKCLLVTCNYKARELGVKKCTFVREAKENCPGLVLLNGEDLTKYREMSYKVTALLEEFTPLVERLGLDENFVDITEMVDLRLEQWKKNDFSKLSLSGHIFNNRTVDLHNPEHIRLAAGSQIAAEMREAVYERLGLTGSAGVASNKLLSKLVSGTFKPNQQTVLLPESRQDLMASLGCISNVPGIGPKTAKRIALLGVVTVCELQVCPASVLENELGVTTAQHVQKLSRGEDDSPVTPTGPPQSLSDEDSFKICSSEAEVKKKVEELLAKLLDRLRKDGRKPYTIRLSIRQCCSTNKWLNRESRQCPIPSHLAQRIGTGDAGVKTHLVALLMKLFRKMINVGAYFHITLLSVCFSNLKAPPTSPKHSIGFYLTRPSPSASCSKLVRKMEDENTENTTPASQVGHCKSLAGERNARITKTPTETTDVPEQTQILEFPPHCLPAGIDYDVFNQLPRDIKEEIISIQKIERNSAAAALSGTIKEGGLDKAQDQVRHAPLDSASTHQNISSPAFCDIPSTSEKPQPIPLSSQHNPPEAIENAAGMDSAGSVDFKSLSPVPSRPSFRRTCIPEGPKHQNEEASGDGKNSAFLLPPTVDPQTFSELPIAMQKELLVGWKCQDPVSKIRVNRTPEKLRKKKKGSLPSSPQSNSLLRYFKPN
ncbi:DNA polymerase iota [Tiliqua scincoides]|uniref:DNA polymerase iota n=1 Tax=Tiliqua scincoides TaxID=71010 RepID=UPI003462AC7F